MLSITIRFYLLVPTLIFFHLFAQDTISAYSYWEKFLWNWSSGYIYVRRTWVNITVKKIYLPLWNAGGPIPFSQTLFYVFWCGQSNHIISTNRVFRFCIIWKYLKSINFSPLAVDDGLKINIFLKVKVFEEILQKKNVIWTSNET